jgi:hypothetical protein
MKRIVVVSLCLLLSATLVATALAATAADLPLTRVVLFSTGVGYFQHDGQVDGDATVPLSFRVEQINDLLKSLVLMDKGGTVGPVTYAPREPLAKALEAFSVNLGDDPNTYQLLRRLRGSEATITTGTTSAQGLILGVEYHQVVSKDGAETLDFVNVLTKDGLRNVPLGPATVIQLTDPKLNDELTAALTAIAGSRDVAKREVDLHFMGQGKRQVSAAYLLETPVWKTTYRLVVGDKPYLQGWAIVENTTDDDWNKVDMALVSGRPVSFTQNLYEPLYAYRPEVPVALPVPVTPRTEEGALEEEQAKAGVEGAPLAMAMPAPAAPGAKRARVTGWVDYRGGLGGGLGGGAYASNSGEAGIALQEGVTAVAQGERAGELFSYQIKQPVTIERQKSAMIPIIATDIGGEKLDLYNGQTNALHPLNAFRLKNTSGEHLMAGAITVFDGGMYAGDALIDDLSAGDERLITYAVDLGTEVAVDRANVSADVSLIIDKGVLSATRKNTLTLTYTLKDRTQQPRVVLVEQPKMPDWTLVAPAKPAETTADYYRFRVAVAAGATEKLTVTLEQPVVETVILLSPAVTPQLTLFLQSTVISPQVKAALQEIITRRTAISELADERQQKEARLTEIGQEQDRIRQNMAQLDRNSDLYKTYVVKLTAQETEFDATRDRIAKLRDQEKKLQDDLDGYIRGLKVG